MKYLFLISILAACTPCKMGSLVSEAVAKSVIEQLECANKEAVFADIKDVCADHDLCGKEMIQVIEEPGWTEASLSCRFILAKVELLPLRTTRVHWWEPATVQQSTVWGCKKAILDLGSLEKVCAKL